MLNTSVIPNGLLSKNDVTTEELHEADDWGSVYSYNLMSMICVCVVLGAIVLGTILGNIFVISAILLQKSLRATKSNYLILSLAVTDLTVAVFVLPVSIENQVTVRWRLQAWVCDKWTSMDVMCCTASILHLLMVINRYLSVTYMGYTRRLSTHEVVLMIAMVWCVSFCISIPPLLGWRDSKQSPQITGYCVVSQDPGYALFAILGSFYIPLIFIIILNLKIYRVAKGRVKNYGANGSRMPQPSQSDTACTDTACGDQRMNATSTTVTKENRMLMEEAQQTSNNLRTVQRENSNILTQHKSYIHSTIHSLFRPRVFLINAFCKTCYVSELAVNLLGFVNSMVNPFIYTMFNLKFSKTFREFFYQRLIRKTCDCERLRVKSKVG
ncbi:octopamine receptor-like [Liolophura sinensis]|uniref:octopamine receptor-like n=1 Tax=Liolophura sinensis TaxID=3198878 RepID=UPI003157FC9C